MKICPECNQEVDVNTFTYNTYTCDICGRSYHDKCCPNISTQVSDGHIIVCKHCLEKYQDVYLKIKNVLKMWVKAEQAQLDYQEAQRELEDIVARCSYKV